MPCGASRETVKRSEFAGHAAYGYCASHSRYLWGFRLYLLAPPTGCRSSSSWRRPTPPSATGGFFRERRETPDDNGFFQGEHRVKGGKLKVYEPSVRVPALMRGPGVPRDRRVSALTANIDLASTIVDAADAQPRRTLDGVSLLELARRPSVFAGRDILLENFDSNPRQPRYSAIRTSRFKYVKYVTGERELYDLLYDPYEERSLHDSPRYADVRRGLAPKLARLRDCSGATCRR